MCWFRCSTLTASRMAARSRAGPAIGPRLRQRIDAFVLNMATAEQAPYPGDYGTHGDLWEFAGSIRDRHERLLELAARPNGTLLTYEQMIDDFDRWLSAIAAAIGVTDPAVLSEVALRHRDALPEVEDIFAKHRQARPGDHRAKLKPETIAQLDEIFGPYFRRLAELLGGAWSARPSAAEALSVAAKA